MEHLVRFTSAEGRDGYHQAPNLEDAVKFVERLRNREGVENVRLFRLQEVPIEFRPYFRVEVRTDAVEPAGDAAVPATDEAAAGEAALVGSSTGADGEGNGRRLFGRS